MEQLEKLVRLIIQRNEPSSTIMVLVKVVIPKPGKVFLNCVYVINNISAFSLSIQSETIKQKVADEWGQEISKKVERTLGIEVGYIHNLIISEKQYKDKRTELSNKGFY